MLTTSLEMRQARIGLVMVSRKSGGLLKKLILTRTLALLHPRTTAKFDHGAEEKLFRPKASMLLLKGSRLKVPD